MILTGYTLRGARHPSTCEELQSRASARLNLRASGCAISSRHVVIGDGDVRPYRSLRRAEPVNKYTCT